MPIPYFINECRILKAPSHMQLLRTIIAYNNCKHLQFSKGASPTWCKNCMLLNCHLLIYYGVLQKHMHFFGWLSSLLHKICQGVHTLEVLRGGIAPLPTYGAISFCTKETYSMQHLAIPTGMDYWTPLIGLHTLKEAHFVNKTKSISRLYVH